MADIKSGRVTAGTRRGGVPRASRTGEQQKTRNKKGSASGTSAASRLPRGVLREKHWAALVRLYAAGPEGIESRELLYGPGRIPWYPTLARLAHYRPQPLVELKDRGGMVVRTYYCLTLFGFEYYVREWRRYRALYPEVNAPKPKTL